MSFNKKHAIGAAVAMALSLSAQADLIIFDPTGTAGAAGNIANVQTFDYAPGNALAIGVNSTTGITAGTNFTLLYQANLGIVLNNVGVNVYTNGVTNFFTAVAGFGETVATCTGSPCNTATFTFNTASTTNFFKIYQVTTTASNLAGTGFTSSTLILSGRVIADGFGSNFLVTSADAGALDQSVTDNYLGIKTIGGIGATALTVQIDSVNANYFPDLLAGGFLSFSAFNTSQILPFREADPSDCFVNLTGTASCAINNNIGNFNGRPISGSIGGGQDIQFQADSNQSFGRRAVPEPATLALMGMGLLGLGLGLGATGRARRKNA